MVSGGVVPKAARSFRVTLSAAALFLLATIVTGIITNHMQLEATRWVEHTTSVTLALAQARLHLRDAECASLDRQSPVPSLETLKADARETRILTSDNPRQQERLDLLEGAISDALATDDAEAWRRGAGMRSILDQMVVEENALMSAREASRHSVRSVMRIILGTMTVAAAVLSLAMLAVLFRQQRFIVRQGGILESVLEGMGDGVLAVDARRIFLVANSAARSMFAQAESGRPAPTDWAKLQNAIKEDGTPLPSEDSALPRALRGQTTDGLQFFLERPDGTRGRWLSATGRPLVDSDGSVVGGVAVYRDVTDLRHQAEQLRALSLTDELTGLYNRRGFLLLAEQHERLARRERSPFALVYADLNGLKRINDSLGHEVGDRAIRDAGQLLKATFRTSDIVARLGGDEFVVLVTHWETSRQERFEERLRMAIQSHNERQNVYHLSMSTGRAIWSQERTSSIHELLAEADRLMYANKLDRRRSLRPATA